LLACMKITHGSARHLVSFEGISIDGLAMAQELATVLGRGNHIVELSLASTNLSLAELRVLLPVLATHPTLHAVNLSNNALDDVALDELITALSSSDTISWINLTGNPGITRAGLTNVAHKMESFRCIKVSGMRRQEDDPACIVCVPAEVSFPPIT